MLKNMIFLSSNLLNATYVKKYIKQNFICQTRFVKNKKLKFKHNLPNFII